MRMPLLGPFSLLLVACLGWTSFSAAEDKLWAEYPGSEGPGQGKHIVLISGDEEYRSEEVLPQLGKILARHHGFRCTVLFSIDPATGVIDPNVRSNIPGLEALQTADLMILALRFRDLPDEQMQQIVDYVQSGRPIIGLRTSTHAFNIKEDAKFARYGWTSKDWDGGFGRQVLGETWINHHGAHGKQSTRGVIAPGAEDHPILRGVAENSIWGPTDVYGVRLPLPGDSQPLVLGQVLEGMQSDSAPATGKVNEPMMPVAWTKTFQTESGKTARVFTTTMGASQDLLSEGVRRMLVNACYWCLNLTRQIDPQRSVALVGTYEPSPFKFNGARQGVRPADHRLP